MIEALDSESAWAAVKRRDRAFDGRFVTGVMTTGIYCRPSCAARHPKRDNVQFFANGEQARAAGLRPCKRCRPDETARDEAAVASVLDAIRSADGKTPGLADLSELTGYSATHLQRLFKGATGLSPSAYARALRAERASEALGDEARVTDAIYAAGYSAPSRFYDDMKGRLGMRATAWKNGGAGETIRYAVVPTWLGDMLVAATDKGVCRLTFDTDVAALEALFPKAELVEGGDDFEKLLAQVVEAVEQPAARSDIPLDVRGTAFQQKAWEALRQIPPGETRSYGEIAAQIGHPKAVRAVGSANARNNVAILIPCHRVIASDGTLGGYAYGLEMKQKILDREAE